MILKIKPLVFFLKIHKKAKSSIILEAKSELCIINKVGYLIWPTSYNIESQSVIFSF